MSGSSATGILGGGGGGGAGFFSSIAASLRGIAGILPDADPAAFATIAVQAALLGAVLIIGAVTVRDLWREGRR